MKSDLQKIRSGQSFLYRSAGYNSTVIDIEIKKKVWGCFLTQALLKSIKRYPYFASKLVERNGDFYIADGSDISMVVKKNHFSKLGSMAAGYHLIEVSYSGYHIFVSFHHALCDGRGIQPFVETLVYYYFCFAKHKDFKADNVRKADSPLLEGETAEPFSEKFAVENDTPPTITKDGFALPECAHQTEICSRFDIEINGTDFLNCAHSVNATPSILLSSLFSKSIALNNEGFDKPIVTSLAADMREDLGLPNTHKNCVRSIYLPFNTNDLSADAKDFCSRLRTEIKNQRNKNYIKSTVNSFIGLSDKLDSMNSLEEKKNFMSFFDKMTINTFVLSYLGTLDFGECNQFIQSVHFYSGGIKGITINMICSNNQFNLSIIQNVDGDKYVETLLSILDELKIQYTCKPKIYFDTPKDKAQKTARFQSERFHIKKK